MISLASLSSELRWLRKAARLSGPALAAALGVSQSGLSRWETGDRSPEPELVEAWLDACIAAMRTVVADKSQTVLSQERAIDAQARMADAGYRTGLVGLARDATEVLSNFMITRAGLVHRQRDLAEMADRERLFRHYQPLMCPGPLQTLDYAQAVMLGFTAVTREEALAAAQARWEGALKRLGPGSPEYEVITTEAALRLRLAHAEGDLRPDLLRHLRAVSELGHVRLHIIPLDAVYGHVPSTGFGLHYPADDSPPFVLTETYSAQVTFSAPRDISRFEEAWRELTETALSVSASRAWLDEQISTL
ncbi:hypothetical protein Lfu02_49710 [Longispora fulva]|nr:hypothetical protein Lfu02_49710 [Longispora fulva]